MAGDDDRFLSPHPVLLHGQGRRSHGGRSRYERSASPRRREGLEIGGREGGSSSSSSGYITTRGHHSRSVSTFRSAAAAAFSRSSSTSSDEEFWPHRSSPSAASGSSLHHHQPSGSGGGRSVGGISSPHTSWFALRSRGGGSGGRGERADEGGGGRSSASGWSSRGDNSTHGRRGSSLFLSLVDSEGSSRSRSIEHCLEPSESSFGGAMLPGVEVARRRRVRLPESYEGGGSFGGGHEAGSHSSRLSRSGAVTVAHHHHHYHHHHHHHAHHQPVRHPSRPGTPRPGSLVRRMQDILQEHRARSPFQQMGSSSSSSTDRMNAVEANPTSHRSSRGHGGHRMGEGGSRMTPLSSMWRRQASDSSSNLRGAALEARNRLDERLRAASRTSHSRRNWQSLQTSPYDMNLLFSDDEEDNFWSDDDGSENSINEWLAVWAPTAWVPSSVEERWSRGDSSGSARASSSRNPTYKPRPSEGLSKAAINALPRQIVGSSPRAQAGSSTNKMEQEDCPVCLEGFQQGQSLMILPCDHRFHPDCLTPWLTNHGQCPYCRADIVKDVDMRSEQKNSRLMGQSDEELLSWVEAIERGMDRLSYS